MSQRDSGYERKERDLYETPEWVTLALVPHLPRRPQIVWEPACGNNKMVAALNVIGVPVYGTDIAEGQDFFGHHAPYQRADAIITNPPYEHATEFIGHALTLMKETGGMVAMLLRTDFDHSPRRAAIFARCDAFAKKLVLTKRIVWFDGPKKANPSFNHAWFIWDWQYAKAPTLSYSFPNGV